MDRDDIIRMAREAHLDVVALGKDFEAFISAAERFAALVAAAEREAYQHVHRLLEVHQAALEASEKPGPWPAKEVLAKAVAAEREACARVCEGDGVRQMNGDECAAAIRARVEQSVGKSEQVPTVCDDYLEKCPNCNGPADNGFDRSWPDPNPYFCTKCMKAMEY